MPTAFWVGMFRRTHGHAQPWPWHLAQRLPDLGGTPFGVPQGVPPNDDRYMSESDFPHRP
jgi:hypothetical protein